MKRFLGLLVVLGVLLWMGGTPPVLAATGINPQIPLNGMLRDDKGRVLDGDHDMHFRIYDAPEGGALLWTGTHTAANGNAVSVNDGYFNVLLGSGAGNTLTIDFSDDTYYLGITIGDDVEMVPRERIGAAAYAFNADRLDGVDIAAFVRNSLPSLITAATDTPLFTLKQLGGGDILNLANQNDTVFRVDTDGNVAIGSMLPESKLHVDGVVTAANFMSTVDSVNTLMGPLRVESPDDSYYGGDLYIAEGSGLQLGGQSGGLKIYQDTGLFGMNDLVIGYRDESLGNEYVNIAVPDSFSITANAASGGDNTPSFYLSADGSAGIYNNTHGLPEDRYLMLDFTSGVYMPSGDLTLETGSLGIGVLEPDAALDVDGSIQATTLAGDPTSLSTDVNGNIIRDPSDERLKTNIRTIDGALDTVLDLRGVRYEWKDTERFGTQTEVGFIAQELEPVLPEVVRGGGEYLSVNTRNIVAVVVEAIKELYAETREYFARTEQLEREVSDLRRELNALKGESTAVRTETESVASESTSTATNDPVEAETAPVPETTEPVENVVTEPMTQDEGVSDTTPAE